MVDKLILTEKGLDFRQNLKQSLQTIIQSQNSKKQTQTLSPSVKIKLPSLSKQMHLQNITMDSQFLNINKRQQKNYIKNVQIQRQVTPEYKTTEQSIQIQRRQSIINGLDEKEENLAHKQIAPHSSLLNSVELKNGFYLNYIDIKDQSNYIKKKILSFSKQKIVANQYKVMQKNQEFASRLVSRYKNYQRQCEQVDRNIQSKIIIKSQIGKDQANGIDRFNLSCLDLVTKNESNRNYRKQYRLYHIQKKRYQKVWLKNPTPQCHSVQNIKI